MFELKEQIFEIISSASKNDVDRKRWLGPEVASLGLKHDGLDNVPLDSILVLAALFANGVLDDSEILELTEIPPLKLSDYSEVLCAYSLVYECQASGKYQLTDKGESVCDDIFKKVVIRKCLELKRDLENIERIYSKMFHPAHAE